MNLPEGAIDWLEDIQARKLQLIGYEGALKLETRRREKLRSDKAQGLSDAILEQLEVDIASARAYVAAETLLFFKNIFNVSPKQTQVTIRRGNGRNEPPFLVENVTAELIADKTAVFTLCGDSMNNQATNGLPVNDYHLVTSNSGDLIEVVA
jgi:hypothetical protein